MVSLSQAFRHEGFPLSLAKRLTVNIIITEFLGEGCSGQTHAAWSHALHEVSGIILQGAGQALTTKASTSKENQNNLHI